MKIYYKKSFISGVFSLLLGVACGGLMVVRGFEIKLLVGLLLLLVLGGVDILWSLSRDSRASRGDERDRLICETSAWRAYGLLTNGCFFVSLVLLAGYAIFQSPMLLTAALTLDGVVLAAFLLLLGANLFYEKRM